ncbi:polymer-forming cytoskeletal protein [Borrelia coriaceae]|uniref:Cytosolic protein n=1 Tax=Borrelia coriaceae ATCC 43381 TaxID=1408429 RepID=W5SU86_9SPIR|nr:polymer-forming cytoskeletal protein [Borrelia coriaceae]AHH10407.1 Putative cytosolic protein [Borrelia coriaceae ATCC 43381]UPA16115.1 polymer-forming cytoskeletal protein [Borrelia coriaceae]
MLNLLSIKKDKRNASSFFFAEVKTVVGEGDFFKGELISTNFIRIDGDFLGNINSSKRVIVGETGRIKSNIHANEVVVSGIVLGNVHASNKVKVFQSGCIIGNISCRSIEVEEGAIIDGYMNIGIGSLSFSEKDVLIYTGSYKVDEDILIEVNKGMKHEEESKELCIDERDKYLLNDMSKVDED